jgi:hypothetical protein
MYNTEATTNPGALIQDNWEIINEQLFKWVPATGSSIGAPSSGAHVLHEWYRDENRAIYVCTVAGTPGTWVQFLPAVVDAFPGTPPTNYWVARSDENMAQYYYDGANWQRLFGMGSELSGPAQISGSNTSVTVAISGLTTSGKVAVNLKPSTGGFAAFNVDVQSGQFVINVAAAPSGSLNFDFDYQVLAL